MGEPAARSRYHAFKQHDGRGWGVLRQDRPGSAEAIVIEANLSETNARTALDAYRREESIEAPAEVAS